MLISSCWILTLHKLWLFRFIDLPLKADFVHFHFFLLISHNARTLLTFFVDFPLWEKISCLTSLLIVYFAHKLWIQFSSIQYFVTLYKFRLLCFSLVFHFSVDVPCTGYVHFVLFTYPFYTTCTFHFLDFLIIKCTVSAFHFDVSFLLICHLTQNVWISICWFVTLCTICEFLLHCLIACDLYMSF